MNKQDKRLIGFYFISTIIIIAGSFFVGYRYGKTGVIRPAFPNTTPVEKNVIDTLYVTREHYNNTIKYIDSIKHDTIEKVYIISDSATIELFYKLVSE